MRYLGTVLSSWCLLYSAISEAEQVNIARPFSVKAKQFSVNPNVCIQQVGHRQCQLQLLFSWQLNQASTVCIRSDDISLLNWCGYQSAQGQKTLKLLTDKSLTFTLSEQASGKVLATTKLTVAAVKVVKQRRRFRHPWSIF